MINLKRLFICNFSPEPETYHPVKRLLAIFLWFIIFLNAGGFYIFFYFQLQQTRREMREAIRKLPPHQLEIFKLDAEKFAEARVDDHEIRLNNRMYDIARVEKKGAQFIVYALHDEKEDNLLAFLDHVSQSPFSRTDTTTLSLQFLSFVFLIPDQALVGTPDAMDINHKTAFMIPVSHSFKQEPIHPPRINS